MTQASQWSARGPALLGGLALGLLVFGLGGWSATARIGGAIISQGQVEVERNQQVVQHLDGGIVEQVLVSEGEAVAAGTPMFQLDGSDLASQLALAESQLFEALARIGRLEAEQEGAEAISFAPALLAAAGSRPEVAELVEGQRRLFQARLRSLARETEQLGKQREQVLAQVEGIDAQLASHRAQLDLIEEELTAQESLRARGLTQASTVLALRREQENLRGTIGELVSKRAETLERATEIEIELLKLPETRREDATTQLRDLSHTARQAAEERRAVSERITRLTVTAPVSGVVLGLAVQTPHSVIQPGAVLAYLVPQDRPLVIGTRISPRDIDQVHPGQPVKLRLSALDPRQTPELEGEVMRISPDVLQDPSTGQSYYQAELRLASGQLARLAPGSALLPGMPVECFIATGDHTALTYLLKPLADHFARAMRES